MANAQKTQQDDLTAQTGNAAQDNAENTTQNTETTNQTTGSNSQLADKVGSIVSGDTGVVKDVLKQAKESTGQVASQAYGVAAKKATSAIDEQKTNLTQDLTSVANNIRQLGENLRGAEQAHGIVNTTAKYSDTLATQVEQLSHYLDRKDLRELTADVERFARRNPAVFLGGAFVLGLLAARFLKSGNPNQALMRRGAYENEGVYLPENFDNQSISSGSRNDFTTGVSDTEDFTTDISGTRDTTTGTGGTKNTTKGSSNKGG